MLTSAMDARARARARERQGQGGGGDGKCAQHGQGATERVVRFVYEPKRSRQSYHGRAQNSRYMRVPT